MIIYIYIYINYHISLNKGSTDNDQSHERVLLLLTMMCLGVYKESDFNTTIWTLTKSSLWHIRLQTWKNVAGFLSLTSLKLHSRIRGKFSVNWPRKADDFFQLMINAITSRMSFNLFVHVTVTATPQGIERSSMYASFFKNGQP